MWHTQTWTQTHVCIHASMPVCLQTGCLLWIVLVKLWMRLFHTAHELSHSYFTNVCCSPHPSLHVHSGGPSRSGPARLCLTAECVVSVIPWPPHLSHCLAPKAAMCHGGGVGQETGQILIIKLWLSSLPTKARTHKHRHLHTREA